MDANTFFQDRVLSRLYGETKPVSPEHEDDPVSDSDVTDVKVDTVKRKVYGVSPAPSDWCEMSSVTVNPNSGQDTSLSDTHSSSEDSGSDDFNSPAHKRRKRRGKRFKMDPKCTNSTKDSEAVSHSHSGEHTNHTLKNSVEDELKSKLTKNQKRKLKKKKRNEKVKQNFVNQGIGGEFVYSCSKHVNKTDT